MKKILLGLLIVSLIITGCGKKKEEGKKEEKEKVDTTTYINTNENYQKEQTIDGLLFYNASLVKVNYDALFEVTVKNISENDINLFKVNISLKDKEGNVIQTLEGLVAGSIARDKERVISVYYSGEIDKVDSVTYEIVK